MMHRAFIALGSNLEDPAAQVRRALLELDNLPQTQLLRASSLYRTAPEGYADQPDFINAVAVVATALAPQPLLATLLALENAHGRKRSFPNAPRALDLDLLLYDDLAMNTPELTLPHPRMHERSFVLLPLAEIAPHQKIGTWGEAAALARVHTDPEAEKLPPC